MPGLRLAPPDDWPSLGWTLIDWIEDYLAHGPGDIEGEPIELDDDFARLIVDCYRLYPKGHESEGRRVVRRATMSDPKGRAKSELAGMLCCAELLGPVRFDGWDAAGEPVGRPVRSPFIRCLATEEGQSGNTYDNVYSMLNHGRDKHNDVFKAADVGLTRVLLGGGGEIRPSTAAASSKDGGRETFAVADEIHLYVLPALIRMVATVRRNLRKRKMAEPWMFQTTTMYLVGEKSVAEAEHNTALAEAKRKRRKDIGFLYRHNEGHKIQPEDWGNDKLMLASLKHAYGPAADWMDLPGILAEIRDDQTDPGDASRYFLNQPSETADKAFSREVWDGLADTTFDTSRSWRVWRMYCDPPYWETYVDKWAGQFPKRIASWHTNQRRSMAMLIKAFSVAMRAGEISHDANPTLTTHVTNAYRRQVNVRDPEDPEKFMWILRKEHSKSRNKIDASMAMLLAWEARRDALAKGVRNDDAITLGFDGARFDDSTAMVACHIVTGHMWLVDIWERPEDEDEWEIDERDVHETVKGLMRTRKKAKSFGF